MSLRLWTKQSQQKAHLPTDPMNKPAPKWAHTERKTHEREANPYTHTHTHKEPHQQFSPPLRNHTYKCNYNCCCYSGSWRLCGGMLLKPSGAVRKTLMPKGRDADFRADSVVAPYQSHHTHIHCKGWAGGIPLFVCHGTNQTKYKPTVALSDTDKQSCYKQHRKAIVSVTRQ